MSLVYSALGALAHGIGCVFLISVIFLACCWWVAYAIPGCVAAYHWWQGVNPFRPAGRLRYKLPAKTILVDRWLTRKLGISVFHWASEPGSWWACRPRLDRHPEYVSVSVHLTRYMSVHLFYFPAR